jgi:hypothetical protein
MSTRKKARRKTYKKGGVFKKSHKSHKSISPKSVTNSTTNSTTKPVTNSTLTNKEIEKSWITMMRTRYNPKIPVHISRMSNKEYKEILNSKRTGKKIKKMTPGQKWYINKESVKSH